jgi:DNA-binding response OmpR family regulator
MIEHPSRILVVDDEPDMCWALENILSPDGYAVTATTSGVDALKLIAEENYLVAFVDAKLPDLDGLELSLLIRQISPSTVVILMSGFFYREDIAIIQGLQNNIFTGFIAKPFNVEEIRLMARRVIERAMEVPCVSDPNSGSR